MSSSSSSAVAAAPAENICCWLCGFPIGDMNTGIFPYTNKKTGEGVEGPKGDGYWGKGVGEHIVEPLMGSAFVGVYRTSYGDTMTKNEREFLKREIRWAHRYCNMIKWDLHMVTFRDGTLRVRDGPKDDPDKLIRYLVKNLFAGGVRVGRRDPGSRIFMGPEHQVRVRSGNNWRNLIAYFLDCIDGYSLNEKLPVWIDSRIKEIRAILQDYCDVVNAHLVARTANINGGNTSDNRLAIYESRLRSSITAEGNKDTFRVYQKLPVDDCPSAICEDLRKYSDLDSRTYEDRRLLNPVNENELHEDLNERDPEDDIHNADGEQKKGIVILNSAPPTGNGKVERSGASVQNRSKSDSRAARANKVAEMAEAVCGGGGGATDATTRPIRPRNRIEGIASDGQQVLRLWGYYNSVASGNTISQIKTTNVADVPEDEDGFFTRLINYCATVANRVSNTIREVFSKDRTGGISLNPLFAAAAPVDRERSRSPPSNYCKCLYGTKGRIVNGKCSKCEKSVGRRPPPSSRQRKTRKNTKKYRKTRSRR